MTDTNKTAEAKAAATSADLAKAVQQGRQATVKKQQETKAKEAQVVADLSLMQPQANATQKEISEVETLRAQLAATKNELEQERRLNAGHVHSSFRQASEGDGNSPPIAVIDEYGMVHPFTTNNNDRVALLKMRVQYIYTQEDLAEAIRRANKIQNNEADVNTQMVGAGLSRVTGVPRNKGRFEKDFHGKFEGMAMDAHSQAVDPRSIEVRNDPQRF